MLTTRQNEIYTKAILAKNNLANKIAKCILLHGRENDHYKIYLAAYSMIEKDLKKIDEYMELLSSTFRLTERELKDINSENLLDS